MQGRAYVSDGFSHFLDFSVDDTKMGEGESEAHIKESGPVTVRVSVAAMLGEEADEVLAKAAVTEKPYCKRQNHLAGSDSKLTVMILIEIVAHACRAHRARPGAGHAQGSRGDPCQRLPADQDRDRRGRLRPGARVRARHPAQQLGTHPPAHAYTFLLAGISPFAHPCASGR